MSLFENPMAVFKLLEKSNCRKCNEPTCLAFAAAVFKGSRRIEECPRLSPDAVGRTSDKEENRDVGQEAQEALDQLRRSVEGVDFSEAAARLGGVHTNGKLTLKVLGKDVSIDHSGKFFTDIHVHVWVAVPVLRYVLQGRGKPASGNWVPLRELAGGKDWYRLFGQRCEKPMKKVADGYTDLFEDMVHLFAGRQVERHFKSDISVVLHPLPKVPMLICYWKPEDGLESDLHLFFDDTAEENLHIESLYTLGAGLTQMFEKIAARHG